jgi:hypothetical protein
VSNLCCQVWLLYQLPCAVPGCSDLLLFDRPVVISPKRLSTNRPRPLFGLSLGARLSGLALVWTKNCAQLFWRTFLPLVWESTCRCMFHPALSAGSGFFCALNRLEFGRDDCICRVAFLDSNGPLHRILNRLSCPENRGSKGSPMGKEKGGTTIITRTKEARGPSRRLRLEKQPGKAARWPGPRFSA